MKYSVIEAFQPATELGSATRKVYSYEGTADGCQGAWMLSSADSHLPTLAWRPGSTVQREIKVPLISNNNATLLAALSSAPLQPETGIVFGRVPAGWTVELSGRAERPVFLDDGLHLVPAHVMTSTRYFAFLNAEPGAQLVQLVREDSSDGAVAVPVLNGTATYVDLTHFSKRDFSGIVLDASQADFEGLPNVTVHVVGETFAAAYTDPSGGFTLHDVMVFDDEPFYVETNTRNGYTHRYRISPDASNMREGLRLFRFGDGQLDAYTRQLEGGVSPDSGIAIGALPHLAGIVGLKPEVTPVLGNTTLIPETYTIGDADHLLVDAPMSRTVPRFFAVQLPEGPQIASVKDHGGNTLWSELFVASPAVVNVLSDF